MPGDRLGGEFAFLDSKVDAVGKNRIDEAVGVANAEEALARVVLHAIGKVWDGINRLLGGEIGNNLRVALSGEAA